MDSKILKYKKELDANFYLNYFENIANLYHWSDAEKCSNFLSSIEDPNLQNEIMKIYHMGFAEIKNLFLDKKQLTPVDNIDMLCKKFFADQDVEDFINDKRKVASAVSKRDEKDLFIDAIRRSVPQQLQ